MRNGVRVELASPYGQLLPNIRIMNGHQGRIVAERSDTDTQLVCLEIQVEVPSHWLREVEGGNA